MISCSSRSLALRMAFLDSQFNKASLSQIKVSHTSSSFNSDRDTLLYLVLIVWSSVLYHRVSCLYWIDESFQNQNEPLFYHREKQDFLWTKNYSIEPHFRPLFVKTYSFTGILYFYWIHIWNLLHFSRTKIWRVFSSPENGFVVGIVKFSLTFLPDRRTCFQCVL